MEKITPRNLFRLETFVEEAYLYSLACREWTNPYSGFQFGLNPEAGWLDACLGFKHTLLKVPFMEETRLMTIPSYYLVEFMMPSILPTATMQLRFATVFHSFTFFIKQFHCSWPKNSILVSSDHKTIPVAFPNNTWLFVHHSQAVHVLHNLSSLVSWKWHLIVYFQTQ